MTEYLNSIPVLDDLSNLVKWLLLVNVLLTGATILFAFRAALYKERVEELETEIAQSVNDALSAPLSDDRPISTTRQKRQAQ
ncbi:MAG: hypothetical protein ACR2IE_07170 [Candidatus Sumerlaeaceae bacterium]